MSYILDALKKAEKERQRNTTKELLTSGDTLLPAPPKRVMWPYLLVIALFLNAGLFGWLLGPWHEKSMNLTSSDLNSTSSHTAGKIAAPLPAGAESEIEQGESEGLSADAGNLPTSGTGQPPHGVLTGEGLPQKSISQQDASAVKREETPPPSSMALQATEADRISSPQEETAHGSAEGGNKVYRMSELPESVLQELPDLSISLHLYNDDPPSRLINVKGKTLREGQELSSGLRLEVIRPEGAVFSFKNYRFEVGINSR